MDFLASELPARLPNNPIDWVNAWLEHATSEELQRNPNAMTLVTATPDGRPSARVVLCKSLAVESGFLVFYTNYRSRKVREIDDNPRVSVVFHWDAIGRQVRIEGIARRSPAEESDAYFASRDRGSQVGAWGSDQSQPIESREALLKQLEQRAAELGVDDESTPVPRPPHWGGIRVWPSSIELWIEGASRVHDRAIWRRDLEISADGDVIAGDWSGTRLQP